MRAILIPVKQFAEAKKRLGPYFSGAERAALAMALCQDFFRVVAGVRNVDRVFVVSKEAEALGLAREAGWETIVEATQTSESASVDFASRRCAEQGVRALLRLPIDIPLAETQDIEMLFEQLSEPPAAVLVPSGDGTGTNALLRSPPLIFPSRFGPGSCSLHLAEASSLGIHARLVRNPRLELDVDELADLQRIAPSIPRGSHTAGWLSEHHLLLRGFRSSAAAGPAGD